MANELTREEIATCGAWLERELDLLDPRVLVCLGKLSFDQTLRVLASRGAEIPRPRPRFGHGAVWDPGGGLPLVMCSYHPSQQNTFTGRLTRPMLAAVFEQRLAAASSVVTSVAASVAASETPSTQRWPTM